MQTFVVRLWEPAGAPGADVELLHGVVEHLGSGISQTFTNDGELLTFLRERGAFVVLLAVPADSPLAEGARGRAPTTVPR